jgi:two-component system, NtrC family, response regulator AtoC
VIFVVEDEPVLARSIAEFLVAAGEQVDTFGEAESALEAAKASPPDAIVADLQLPAMGGLQLLSELTRIDPSIVRIAITAHASIQSAVLAMRGGCYEYLEKPLDLQQLHRVVSRALAQRRASTELAWLRGGQVAAEGRPAVLGESEAIAEVRRQIDAVARAGAQAPPILLAGETGVGKGLVARAIHAARLGADAAWIEVNCAAVPATLAEAELFGYERSAFTDAKHAKPSLFEAASGGTIFLDEVGELPLELQAKLLKVVESRTVRRLGAVRERPINAAILAASNVDLPAAVAAGRFRSDLYHRLAAFTIVVPPLRQRGRDAVLLARHFLAELAVRYRRPLVALSPEAEARIAAASWPGNVRELRFALERAVLLAPPDATTLAADHLSAGSNAVPASETGIGARMAAAGNEIQVQLPEGGVEFARLERAILSAALRKAEGNVAAAARLLHMRRDAMRYRLRKHGIIHDRDASAMVHLTQVAKPPA